MSGRRSAMKKKTISWWFKRWLACALVCMTFFFLRTGGDLTYQRIPSSSLTTVQVLRSRSDALSVPINNNVTGDGGDGISTRSWSISSSGFPRPPRSISAPLPDDIPLPISIELHDDLAVFDGPLNFPGISKYITPIHFYVASIGHALIHARGLVYDRETNFLFNGRGPNHLYLDDVLETKHLQSHSKISAPVLNLIEENTEFFQHVPFQTLPLLVVVRNFVSQNPGVRILINDSPQMRTLLPLMLDVSPGQFIWAQTGAVYESNEVYLTGFEWSPATADKPSHYPVTPQGTCVPILSDLNHRLNPGFLPADSPERTQVIYLTRGVGNKRSVENEDEILSVLRAELKEGLELVVFESSGDVLKDAEALKHARLLIGPHGGAFLNMMFLPPGLDVVEFNRYFGGASRPCFLAAGQCMGLRYWVVMPENEFEYTRGPVEGTFMKIGVDAMTEVLGKVGVLRETAVEPIRITDPVAAGIPLSLSRKYDVDVAVFDPPENYGDTMKMYSTPDRWFVADVGHAFIHGRGLVCNETTEFWFNGRGPPSYAKLLGPGARGGATRLQFPVLNLLEMDTEVIQHLSFQTLPLLAVVRGVLEGELQQLSTPVRVLANDLPGLRAMLPLLLDLPPDRFVWAQSETVYESEGVLVGGYQFSDSGEGVTGRYAVAPQGTCVSVVSGMNQRLNPGFLPADSPERTQVFYLTRGVGNKRSVENEEEILSVLREELKDGLELVVFESSGDVLKDAEALKHARLLIGPHGGAFLNMMFLPPGLDVVEFNRISGDAPRPCFLAAGQCMGLRYWVVMPENEFEYTRGPVEGTFMKIGVDAMTEVLGKVGVLRETIRITDPVAAGIPLSLFVKYDADVAVFDPPENYGGPTKLFITPDRWFVADIGHAFIHGRGLVCNETTEFWFNGRGPPSYAKLLGPEARGGATRLQFPVLNLLEMDTEVIQHLSFQTLPLLAVVRGVLEQNSTVRVLANDLPGLRAVLPLLLDLPPDRFVWAQSETVYESEGVLVGGYQFSDSGEGVTGRYAVAPQDTCVSVVNGMNQRLNPGFLPADSPERTQVFYLTRGVGNTRWVENEEEILSVLREELEDGLELVVFESSGDMLKDAEALKHARLLIGPHGGAFLNMMFLPPGLDVVEFNRFMGGGVRHCFIASARCMGLRHWVVEPENEFEYTRGPVEGTWMRVSVDAVVEVLNEVGVLREPIRISDPVAAGIPLSLSVKYDADVAVFDPPENYGGPTKLFITPDRWFVADVGHAFIHGSGLVCNETTEFWFNGRGPPSHAKVLGPEARGGATRLQFPVLNLLEMDTEVIQHLSFQTLPLLAVVRGVLEQNSTVRVLANDLPGLRSVLPLLLDLPPDRFAWAQSETVYESEGVLVGGYQFSDSGEGVTGRYAVAPQDTCVSVVNGMNQRLNPGFLPADSPERTQVFYLTRGVGNTRWVENEEEILSVLREELKDGLELVVFESSGDMLKDAEALKHARLLIGPHGGAFLNMMFLPPGLDVVEFNRFMGGGVRHCFVASARCMGLRHWVVEPENEFEYTRGPVEGTWMRVSVDAVVEVLNEVGVLRESIRISDPVAAGIPLSLSVKYDADVAVFYPPENYGGTKKIYRTPDQWFVADIGHAFIHGSGLVCNETTEFWFNGRGPPSYAKLLGPGARGGATRLQFPVLNLLEMDTEFFQHLPFQTLPLLAVVRGVLEQNSTVRVLANDLPGLRAVLPLLLDLPPDRFVWAQSETVYESEGVLVGGYQFSDSGEGVTGRYEVAPQGTCLSVVNGMNQRLNPGFLPADSPERTQVFYLTRGVGNKRSVENEEEILSVLREELEDGLELVVFESSGDVLKDAEALKHARLLIGPHGGAFLNMMFLPPGLDVVEFNRFIGGDVRHCFIASARCMGLRHWVVEPENEFEYTRGPVEGTWMRVSVDAVMEVLNEVGVLREPNRISDPVAAGIPLSLSVKYDADVAVFDPPENYGGMKKRYITPDQWFVADVGHAFIRARGLVCNETTEFWFNGRGPPSHAKVLGPEARGGATRLQFPVLNLLEAGTDLFVQFPFQTLPLLAVVRGVLEGELQQLSTPVSVLANDLPGLRAVLPLLLDLPPDRFVWAQGETVYESEGVLVGGYQFSDLAKEVRRYAVAPQGMCEAIVSGMNQRLNPGFLPADSTERTKVFYLTRGVDQIRSVLNEEEILGFLRTELKDGLELVVFESSGDVLKDSEALKHARLLIGPHGGEFMNMMFLPPGLDVVEFNRFVGGDTRPCFLAAARCMGLRHWGVEPANRFAYSPRGPVESTWMNISVGAVREVLDQVGVLR